MMGAHEDGDLAGGGAMVILCGHADDLLIMIGNDLTIPYLICQ
jgi:hypothetical protein